MPVSGAVAVGCIHGNGGVEGPGPRSRDGCWRTYNSRASTTGLPMRRHPEFTAEDERWMRQALAVADRAEREDNEVPVGAVLVSAEGELLAEGSNRNINEHDPTAHAEIVALRRAGQRLQNYRLTGTTLYVTLEPCAMCAMALVHARVARVGYGAHGPKTGAAGSVVDLLADPRHNLRGEVAGGGMGGEGVARPGHGARAPWRPP